MVGRHKEKKQIQQLIQSQRSEFVVFYGRRRVGKTYLVRNYFNNQFHFTATGLANASLTDQLVNFNYALQKAGKQTEEKPNNWLGAFQELIQLLEKQNANEKKVIFIDELPWFDTPRSKFINALEHFWNSWASARQDILLICCGSATSWMINKLINNKGGLHNRVTARLHVEPFTLAECEEFYTAKGCVFSRYQQVEIYMALGGIPFYLEALEKQKSAAQNIDSICFSKNGLLKTEYKNLYASLFTKAENHSAVIAALSTKKKGLTRDEIIVATGLANGGGTTQILNDLQHNGFIRKYQPYQGKRRESLYQLSDHFSLFYYQFMQQENENNQNSWLNIIDTQSYRSWSGYAFEQVCLSHLPQIKKALGISGMQTSVASWRGSFDGQGAQIDLLIDRKDKVVNVCEMKFSALPFVIDKTYATALRNKLAVFQSKSKTKNALHLTFLTPYGILPNEHAAGLVLQTLDLDALFD